MNYSGRSPWLSATLLDPPGEPVPVLVAVTPARQVLIQRESGALLVLEFEDAAAAAFIAGSLAAAGGVKADPELFG